MSKQILLAFVAPLSIITTSYTMYKPLSRRVVRHTMQAIAQNVARRTVVAAEKENQLRKLPYETESHALSDERQREILQKNSAENTHQLAPLLRRISVPTVKYPSLRGYSNIYVWHPQGDKIALFYLDDGYNKGKVCIMRLDGTIEKEVVRYGIPERLIYSPDGSKLTVLDGNRIEVYDANDELKKLYERKETSPGWATFFIEPKYNFIDVATGQTLDEGVVQSFFSEKMTTSFSERMMPSRKFYGEKDAQGDVVLVEKSWHKRDGMYKPLRTLFKLLPEPMRLYKSDTDLDAKANEDETIFLVSGCNGFKETYSTHLYNDNGEFITELPMNHWYYNIIFNPKQNRYLATEHGVRDLAPVFAVQKWISDGFASMGTSEYSVPPLMLYALTRKLTNLLSENKKEALSSIEAAAFNKLPREVQDILIEAIQHNYQPGRYLLPVDDTDGAADQNNDDADMSDSNADVH